MDQATADRAARNEGPEHGDPTGFTLLEVIVSMAVLAIIMVPLTTSLIQVLRETRSTSERLDRSNDTQRITAAWTRDVQSLDKSGPKQTGPCVPSSNAGGTDLITFQWDQASVAASSGQTALVPKTATWAATGTGQDMRLVRRYCEAGAFVSEQFLANHIGTAGKSPQDTVYGPTNAGDQTFCKPESCTINIDGSFQYSLEVARRVRGVVPADATPPPPTVTSATPRNKYVSVAWTPPTVPPGVSPIIGYRVEAWTSPTGGLAGFTEINASSNAADITGLANGTSYWIVAYSKNQVGQGEPSDPFGPVVPAPTAPSAPLSVTANVKGANAPDTVTVGWTEPVDDGGSAIDEYEVQAQSQAGTNVSPVNVSGSGRSADYPGLDPGTTYSFRVRAHNGTGWGPFSDPANANSLPPKPTDVVAASGPAKALVSFTSAGNGNVQLVNPGGVRVTATCVTAAPDCTDRVFLLDHPSPSAPNGTFGPLDTSTSLTPLVNGKAYSVTVEQKNSSGFGPRSNAVIVTPLSAPGNPAAVVSVSATGASQTLGFSIGPSDSGGSAITRYEVTETSSGKTLTVAAAGSGSTSFNWTPTSTTVPAGGVNFVNFTNYSFTVKACNALGCSASTPGYVAAPGIAPIAGPLVLARGVPLQSVVASVSLSPTTSGTSATTWTVQCSTVSGSVSTTPGSTTLSNVPSGNQTCQAVPTNNLARVINGTQSTLSLAGSPVSANIEVYQRPGTPPVPTLTLPASGTVNNIIVAAGTPEPSSGGSDPTLTYIATCGSQSSTAGPSPRTVSNLSPGTTVSCTMVAYNTANYASPTSPAVQKRLQRVAPTITSVRGTRTVSVEQGGQSSQANKVKALIVVKSDPGIAPTGLARNLNGSAPASFPASDYSVWKTEASGNDLLTYIWVNITPSDGNWPGIGSNPRAKALTASFNVQMTAGDTTGDATMSYYAVAEWNSSGEQDYPAVYDTADTANGTTLAVNSALRIKFTCDDNDGSGSSDDECDATTIRIRRMTDGNTIQLSCPSKQANSDGCETRSGATLNYFNADDGTTRTYNMLVPAGTGSGLWVVEGKFCNENSSCPASPPGGYGGAADTDYQILGHFYVN